MPFTVWFEGTDVPWWHLGKKKSVSGFVEALVHQLFPCLAFYKQSYAVSGSVNGWKYSDLKNHIQILIQTAAQLFCVKQ